MNQVNIKSDYDDIGEESTSGYSISYVGIVFLSRTVEINKEEHGEKMSLEYYKCRRSNRIYVLQMYSILDVYY